MINKTQNKLSSPVFGAYGLTKNAQKTGWVNRAVKLYADEISEYSVDKICIFDVWQKNKDMVFCYTFPLSRKEEIKTLLKTQDCLFLETDKRGFGCSPNTTIKLLKGDEPVLTAFQKSINDFGMKQINQLI